MGLMSWLKERLTGDQENELVVSEEENSLSGLNLKQVIDAHAGWKTRLENTLLGVSMEQLEVSVVAQDSVCSLGQWLYGAGKQQFGHLPEYEELRKTHANFHLSAGQVLVEHRNGQTAKAMALLKGEFRNLSDLIQLDLVKLFVAAKR
ncbi:MAG: CZB domain-containing protein [Gallionella sp.]|nr:CZB domain-containing protein [Gallionella sp.]MDD4960453.1 CZB domain-containing protein [Gallionella sp.]